MPRSLLLDACSLLNFYASRRVEDILQLPHTFYMAASAAQETRFVRRGGSGDDADEKELIDLAPLLQSNLLTIAPLVGNDEMASYVSFAAARLDDGEAMTCALAVHRQWEVVTDDKRVPRVLHAVAPSVACLSTLEVVKLWADQTGADKPTLQTMFEAMRERASYFPGAAHPLKAWWDAMLSP